jgi:hypothetical protein
MLLSGRAVASTGQIPALMMSSGELDSAGGVAGGDALHMSTELFSREGHAQHKTGSDVAGLGGARNMLSMGGELRRQASGVEGVRWATRA